jgi:hypothetical protein
MHYFYCSTKCELRLIYSLNKYSRHSVHKSIWALMYIVKKEDNLICPIFRLLRIIFFFYFLRTNDVCSCKNLICAIEHEKIDRSMLVVDSKKVGSLTYVPFIVYNNLHWIHIQHFDFSSMIYISILLLKIFLLKSLFQNITK